MSGSLGKLQAEVKVLEDSLQDLARVIVQRKTADESNQKEALEQGWLPNSTCKCDKVRVGH